MAKSSELRARARTKLGGNLFGNTWLMALVVALIVDVCISASGIVVVGPLIVMGPLSFGLALVFLNLSRGKKNIELGDCFKGFMGADFSRTLLLGLLEALYVFLWSLLFVIPGIVKSYSYSQAVYLAVDHPDWDWKKCLDESRKLMKGKKWKRFCLDLSFIGWIIVGSLACGIGILWVIPYMKAASAEFYEEIRGTEILDAPEEKAV